MTGTGIATEATKGMLRLGFEEMGLHRITLRIAVGNVASERIADKLGFTKEGVLREVIEVGGKRLDHSVHSLLRSEWRSGRP